MAPSVTRGLAFDVESSEWGPAEWLAVLAAIADPRGWKAAQVVERRVGADGESYVAIQATAWVPEVKGGQARRNSRRVLRRTLDQDLDGGTNQDAAMEAAPPADGRVGLEAAASEKNALDSGRLGGRRRGGKPHGRRREPTFSYAEGFEAMLLGVSPEELFGTPACDQDADGHSAKWRRTGGGEYLNGEPAGSWFPPGLVAPDAPVSGPGGPVRLRMRQAQEG